MDILSLLDQLEHLITGSRRMPMSNRVLVGEQEALQLIDQMRSAVPEEVKQARRFNQEREHILAQAQVEANRIIAGAEEEAERLINDEELMQEANERAREIEQEAEEQARQLRDGADAYAAETLRSLEEQLGTLQAQIDETILSIHKGLETLKERAQESKEADEEELREEEGEEEEEGVARMTPQRALYDVPLAPSGEKVRSASTSLAPVSPADGEASAGRSGIWRRR